MTNDSYYLDSDPESAKWLGILYAVYIIRLTRKSCTKNKHFLFYC
jgi:hypothetical protein